MKSYRMYIDGEWCDATSGQVFQSENPFTGQPWAVIPRGDSSDVDRAVRAAHRALTSGDWPKLTASRRGAALRRLGDLVAEHSKPLAELEVRDNGKLLAEMSLQTSYIPQWYYYLRRPRRQNRGRGHSHRQARHFQLHAVRTGRRGRSDR